LTYYLFINLLTETLVTELFVENLFYTKFKTVKSSDKISTFLNIMNFYDSITNFKFGNLNKEHIIESTPYSNNKLKAPINNNNTFFKNQTNNLRCVRTSKIKKKYKICKQNSNLKFL
jgi:hypothetical protein